MMWPAKCMLRPTCSFLREIVILDFLHLVRTVLILSFNSSIVVAQIIVSSTICLAQGSPWIMMSLCNTTHLMMRSAPLELLGI